MPAAIEITLEQLPQWARGLAADMASAPLTRPFKAIAIVMASHAKLCFQASRAPDGTAWKPLKRPRSGKRHKGSNPKPLLDTGLLRASVSARGAGHIERIEGNALIFGSNLFYAGWMNDGTKRIPARPFLGFSLELLDTIDDILADYLSEQVGQ